MYDPPKKFRIGLMVLAIVVAGLAIVRIVEYARDSAIARNNKLVERWRDNAAQIRVGMTFDELISILGQPNARIEQEDGTTFLFFETPVPPKNPEKTPELIPYTFHVAITSNIVSAAYMGYR